MTIVATQLKDGGTVFEVQEVILCDAAEITTTKEGYLVAQPRVARSGIQLYRGAEVGKPELAFVRCYRSEAEVFHVDALKTLAHRPITVDHPKEMVNAKNWKTHSVGQTGNEIVRDGEYIRVPMTLMDGEAIDAFNAGKRQLSVGYTSVLKWETGITDSGESYDLLQTNIRANHIAVCTSARGGDRLVIGDSGDNQMTTRKIMLDGFEVEVVDSHASIVTRTYEKLTADIAGLTQKFTDSEKARGEVEVKLVEANKATEAKVGEIAVLNQKIKDSEIKPEALDALVKSRMAVLTKAKAILGDSVSTDGKSDSDLRKLVVSKHLGEDVAKGMSDAALEGAFTAITTKSGEAAPVQDALSGHLSGPSYPSTLTDAEKVREAAYEKRGKMQRDAWHGQAANA